MPFNSHSRRVIMTEKKKHILRFHFHRIILYIFFLLRRCERNKKINGGVFSILRQPRGGVIIRCFPCNFVCRSNEGVIESGDSERLKTKGTHFFCPPPPPSPVPGHVAFGNCRALKRIKQFQRPQGIKLNWLHLILFSPRGAERERGQSRSGENPSLRRRRSVTNWSRRILERCERQGKIERRTGDMRNDKRNDEVIRFSSAFLGRF